MKQTIGGSDDGQIYKSFGMRKRPQIGAVSAAANWSCESGAKRSLDVRRKRKWESRLVRSCLCTWGHFTNNNNVIKVLTFIS